MTSARHALTQRGIGAAFSAVLVVVLPFALACSPLPVGTLTIEGQMVALIDGERHVVIRASATALAEARSMSLHVTLPAEGVDSIVVLPDSPELTGVSVGSGPDAMRIGASAEFLDGLSCDEAVCEIGFTLIVVPTAEGPAPSEIGVSLHGRAPAEQRFSDDATMELEVDGEASVSAERRFQ